MHSASISAEAAGYAAVLAALIILAILGDLAGKAARALKRRRALAAAPAGWADNLDVLAGHVIDHELDVDAWLDYPTAGVRR